MQIRKTALAERDLQNIYSFGFERFGLEQTEIYALELLDVLDLIALNPRMAREHFEFGKAVRIHPHRSHLIVYPIEVDEIQILRVLSRHQSLVKHL